METLQRDFLDIKELAELNLEGVESQMADLLDKIVEVENRAFMSVSMIKEMLFYRYFQEPEDKMLKIGWRSC